MAKVFGQATNGAINSKNRLKNNGKDYKYILKAMRNVSPLRFLHGKFRELIPGKGSAATRGRKPNAGIGTAERVAFLKMLFCVSGIYICFALWSIKQERLMTKPYTRYISEEQRWEQKMFPSVLGVGFCQSLSGVVCATLFMALSSIFLTTKPKATNSGIAQASYGKRGRSQGNCVSTASSNLLTAKFSKLQNAQHIVIIGLFGLISTAFGYFSMRILPYPVVLAAKMSKMLPVIVVGFLWHGTRYSFDKIASCFLITIGILCFYFTEELSEKQKVVHSGFNSTQSTRAREDDDASRFFLLGQIGFVLLFFSLTLDGFISATQDVLVKQQKWSGPKLMLFGNLSSALWALTLMLLLEYVEPLGMVCSSVMSVFPFSSIIAPVWGSALQHYRHHFMSIRSTLAVLPVPFHELSKTINFLKAYPEAQLDLLLLGFLNGFGQLFVFYTIYLFGTLTLTAMTVTRKVGSVMLSIIVYGHSVKPLQWLAFAIIVSGVIWEGLFSIKTVASLSKDSSLTGSKTKTG
ncbi:unnamed protein product [Phytomonas sp. EM1]|nr:unnamed protein product [Phytomonas sp. EM1]|eukprot:CCW61955.1 unnamed protein product [Phytomonas sp. isolate EM1]